MKTQILKIYNEIGGYDVCECEVGGTRILRVLDSSHSLVPEGDGRDREYVIGYAHACGYRD